MIQRFNTGPRMSKMIIHNGVVYLSGLVPEDPSADIAGQAKQVLQAIDGFLKQAGTDKTNVLRAEIFLADMADFDGMNQVWEAWVAHDAAPTRATVQAKLAKSSFKIEIMVTAAIP